ncbi:MAG: hypothetical protein KAT71_02985 [Gammaproteobacteria bacterium]|nr:hypothetical protein [Gammaproteobacteria bacterium]
MFQHLDIKPPLEVETLMVSYLTPDDLAKYSQVCRSTNTFVQDLHIQRQASINIIATQLRDNDFHTFLNLAVHPHYYGCYLGDSCCIAQTLRNQGLIEAMKAIDRADHKPKSAEYTQSIEHQNNYFVRARRQFERMIATLEAKADLSPVEKRYLADAYWNLCDMDFTGEGCSGSIVQRAVTGISDFFKSSIRTDPLSKALELYEADQENAHSIYKAAEICLRYSHTVALTNKNWHDRAFIHYRTAALRGHGIAASTYITLSVGLHSRCASLPQDFQEVVFAAAKASAKEQVIAGLNLHHLSFPEFTQWIDKLQKEPPTAGPTAPSAGP